ncbi:MAG: thiamine-monophosphate kinase [Acidobacteria bacterium OLB17]|nr:MAG: thiamine-monophosphate kinase [Acidobacteria bacterium OLB17]MCZ2391868.1 thiamine-phosphate kinase [Acidobacteriota bacterium]
MRSEFDLINHIKANYTLNVIGDDCAILPKDTQSDQLFTVDLLIENIDFRLEWTTPEFLGHKALAVSLSDIAAMGGSPKYALLSLGVPDNLWKTSFLDRFYEGWHRLATEFEVELVGGDISRSPSGLTIDSFVVGEAARGQAIRRSSAQAGDKMFVTGPLGGAALGLSLLEKGERFKQLDGCPGQAAILRQLKPRPQVAFGKLLLNNALASSAIDISDGLSSDLAHICEASGVGAHLDAAAIPIAEGASLEMALHGGEDFELLFTVPADRAAEAEASGAIEIGHITGDAGKVTISGAAGIEELKPMGFQHF